MSALEDELGDIVGKARKGLGFTPDQLAQMTNLSARDIESVEAYRLTPSDDQLCKLADALSLDAAKLTQIASGSWSPAPQVPFSDPLIVESIQTLHGKYPENCYLIGCSKSKLAAIVDPGGEVEEINSRLTELGLTLDLILVTHAHGDHIGGVKQLASDWHSVRLMNHQLERDSIMRGLPHTWEPAQEKVSTHLGDLTITPLFTPGHSPGSTCYRINGLYFVGDTLFAGSIGRPAGHGVYRQMLNDIQTKLLSLPDETVLFPGHGPATTVAQEKAHNPFFHV